MGLDHTQPASKEKNAVIIQTWISEGLHKSGGEIQRALGRRNEHVANYSQGSLTRKLANDWRKRIRKELEWRQSVGQIPSPVESVDYSVAREMYDNMFHFDRCGRSPVFGEYFVEELKKEVEDYRQKRLPLLFSTFVGLSEKVAKRLDGDGESAVVQVARNGTYLWDVRSCSESTLWNLLKRDCGYDKREGSSSEPLPYKAKEMGEVFVAKLLSIIKEWKVPPELVLNLDETAAQILCVGKHTFELPTVKDVRLVGSNDKRAVTYTPVVSANGSVILSQLIVPGKSKLDDGEAMWQQLDGAPHLRSHKLLVSSSGGRKQWQNKETFRHLVAAIDQYVKSWIDAWGKPRGAEVAILVLDCAGSHTSGPALEILEEFPRIIPVFVPPRMTSQLQPLDKSFFAPFKKVLRTAVAQFMLSCHDTLGSVPEEGKEQYLKQVTSRKNLMQHFKYDWLPKCLLALSPTRIMRGWIEVVSGVFPQLIYGLYSEVDLDSPFWQFHLQKANEWPGFNERAKLKDILYGSTLSNYSQKYLQSLCRERQLPVSGRTKDLVARLNDYETAAEDLDDSLEASEGHFDKENDEPNENAEGFILYENEEDEAARVEVNEEVEVECPQFMDQFFEVERFAEVFDETDQVEVKWKGYSERHNTIEDCSKLTVELGESLFDDLRREVLGLPKERPYKRRK